MMTSLFSNSSLKIATNNYSILYHGGGVYIQTTKFIIKINLDMLKMYYEFQLNKELNIDEFIQYKLPIICDDLFEFGSDIYSEEELEHILDYSISEKYNVVCTIISAKNS